MAAPPLHLAAALDGAGWHPAAWREPGARPGELFQAGYWVDLVREARAGLLDFVTFEDSLSAQSARLDAVLVAARVAPVVPDIGLVPTVTVTHTEPFHIAKAIATLDYVSTGRGGFRVQVSGRTDEAAHFGRREFPAVSVRDRDSPVGRALRDELFAEAAEYVEVVRRLWDSWEDDAEIRDTATGRFIDREKLHYIDFTGRFFSVKGPSIVPRPPQGQPLVTALAHAEVPYRFAAAHADLVYVTPTSAADAARIVAQVPGVIVFADLLVYLAGPARDRRARLDATAPYESDAHVFAGTPAELADLLLAWQAAGIAGFRLRPAVLPDDLVAIGRELVPELQRRDAFGRGYRPGTLRDRLGLPRPANRYAATA